MSATLLYIISLSDKFEEIMKTQKDRVLDLLQQRRHIGITSQELRDLTHIVDIPKCISLLRDNGHQISDKAEKLGDSQIKRYFLGSQPNKPIRWKFDNVRNVAIPIYG